MKKENKFSYTIGKRYKIQWRSPAMPKDITTSGVYNKLLNGSIVVLDDDLNTNVVIPIHSIQTIKQI